MCDIRNSYFDLYWFNNANPKSVKYIMNSLFLYTRKGFNALSITSNYDDFLDWFRYKNCVDYGMLYIFHILNLWVFKFIIKTVLIISVLLIIINYLSNRRLRDFKVFSGFIFVFVTYYCYNYSDPYFHFRYFSYNPNEIF